MKSLPLVRFLGTSPGPGTTSCFSCTPEVVLAWPGLAVVVVVVVVRFVRLELAVVLVMAVELSREVPASGAILDSAFRVTFEVVFE